MMVVGIPGLSMDEYRTHFSMWCVSAVPLWLGCDLSVQNESVLDIVRNAELIAVNQDAWGFGAMQLDGLHSAQNNTEVWWKVLQPREGEMVATAVMLWNADAQSAQAMQVAFWEIGLNGAAKVRDLWQGEDLGVMSNFSATVPPHGCVVLRVTQ